MSGLPSDPKGPYPDGISAWNLPFTIAYRVNRTCVDEISHIRRNAIVRAFLDALTKGGSGGTPRPIEVHAVDPQRYVGDMLAWLHQTAANEREILEGLLDLHSAGRCV